jgi:hypothetical protein
VTLPPTTLSCDQELNERREKSKEHRRPFTSNRLMDICSGFALEVMCN